MKAQAAKSADRRSPSHVGFKASMSGDVLTSCCGCGLPVAQLFCGVSVGVLLASREVGVRAASFYATITFIPSPVSSFTTPPRHQNQKAWLLQTTNCTGTRFLCQPWRSVRRGRGRHAADDRWQISAAVTKNRNPGSPFLRRWPAKFVKNRWWYSLKRGLPQWRAAGPQTA